MTTPTDAQIDARIANAFELHAKHCDAKSFEVTARLDRAVADELREPEPEKRSDIFACPSCSLRCRVRHCTTHVDCHGTGVHTKSDTACIHVAVEARKDEPEPAPAPEPTYPCAKCGALRTKAEGGTTFTVCDKCWDESHPVGGANTPPQPAPPTPAWCNHCRAPWTAATCAGLAHLGQVTGAMPQPTQPQPTPSQPSLTLEQQAAIIAAQSGITECLLGTSQPSLVERLRERSASTLTFMADAETMREAAALRARVAKLEAQRTASEARERDLRAAYNAIAAQLANADSDRLNWLELGAVFIPDVNTEELWCEIGFSGFGSICDLRAAIDAARAALAPATAELPQPPLAHEAGRDPHGSHHEGE